jgi:hypothetical protein
MRAVLDEEKLAEIRSSQSGFLFNDFSPTGDPAYNVLHWAGCRWLARMNMGVAKIYFETLAEAEDFLNEARGPENVGWKRCATCAASAPAALAVSSLESRRPAAAPAPEIVGELDEPDSRFAVRGGPDRVEAWAGRRLQYEPRDWQLPMRESLREAIASLELAEVEIVHASYLSPLADECDAENAVIYNVGASCFRRPARHGLRFERGFGPVPQPPGDVPGADHYYRYEGSARAGALRYWVPRAEVCELETEGCGPLSETTKVASFWHAVKSARVEIKEPLPPAKGPFALSLSLSIPESSSASPAALIKPLFWLRPCSLTRPRPRSAGGSRSPPQSLRPSPTPSRTRKPSKRRAQRW